MKTIYRFLIGLKDQILWYYYKSMENHDCALTDIEDFEDYQRKNNG